MVVKIGYPSTVSNLLTSMPTTRLPNLKVADHVYHLNRNQKKPRNQRAVEDDRHSQSNPPPLGAGSCTTQKTTTVVAQMTVDHSFDILPTLFYRRLEEKEMIASNFIFSRPAMMTTSMMTMMTMVTMALTAAVAYQSPL